jgi:hypothetical protein
MPAQIRIGAAEDGTPIYIVDHPPSDLPPVRGRDIEQAWAAARAAAPPAGWRGGRAFRFRRADGTWTDLALADRDALCWAAAVDRAVGMQTGYGISICLRLLALVDLLGRAAWLAGMVDLEAREAALHPALLRLAAEARLNDDAGFDEQGFRANLPRLPKT